MIFLKYNQLKDMLGRMNTNTYIIVFCLILLLGFYYLYSNHMRNDASMDNYSSSEGFSTIPKILGFPSFPKNIKDTFYKFNANKTNSKDPELIKFLKSIMIPPSKNKLIKWSRTMIKTPQATEIDIILNKKTNGFFVEAGALDGERSSNSIFFEVKRNWTGLLVEPDPFFFTQLVGKNRNSWAINACLSPYNYVSKLRFEESAGGHGKLRVNDSSNNKFIIEVPCFPLESILLALGRTTVDFFSLDVEGAEVPVLKTIPFSEIQIKTLAVEYKHGDYQQYLDVMKTNGYDMTKKLLVDKPELNLYVEDFIFVKK